MRMTESPYARKTAIAIMAAGKGTRLKSKHPKVLHARNEALESGVIYRISTLLDAAENGACDQELRELVASLLPEMAKCPHPDVIAVSPFERPAMRRVNGLTSASPNRFATCAAASRKPFRDGSKYTVVLK